MASVTCVGAVADMSLRANVAASYASQIYVSLMGIVMMPIYLQYMGPESFGLIAFFAVLQGWFQLLDLGLTPTLSREAARFSGGATDGLTLRRLLRVLECIFGIVAIGGAASLVAGADWIGTNWLQAQQLPSTQLRHAIELMGGIIAARWMSSLYRSALSGLEFQVWLGKMSVVSATVRFVGVIPVLVFLGATPVHFFVFQSLAAVVETGALMRKTYRCLPALAPESTVGISLSPLRGVLRFSLGLAFTSAVWVAVTQTDKLLLSRLLSLSDYAYFALAALVASGVTIVSGPLSGALLPRLSRLHAQGRHDELVALYRRSTQGMAVIATPVTVVLACAAEPLLYAWTGDTHLAARAAPILQLYAMGNGVLAMSAFAYYLQFAKGDVQLHFIGSIVFVLVLIPSIWLATVSHGAMGAAWAWLSANIAYALLWVPMVHRRFAPGLHWPWLLQDVAAIAAPVVAGALMLTRWAPWPQGRFAITAFLILIVFLALGIAALASSQIRSLIWIRIAATKHA